MSIIFVGIGGIFGSLARYRLGKIISEKSNSTFPVGTFIINITGAILLGVVSSLAISAKIHLLLADGFLGAYTTFSTFMYEGFNLFQEREKLNALIYVVGSLILGIIGYALGCGLVYLIEML